MAEEGEAAGRRRTRAPGAMAVEVQAVRPALAEPATAAVEEEAAAAGRQRRRPERVPQPSPSLSRASSSASAGLGGAGGGGAEPASSLAVAGPPAAGAAQGRCRPAERTRSRHWWTGRRRRGPVPAAPAAHRLGRGPERGRQAAAQEGSWAAPSPAWKRERTDRRWPRPWLPRACGGRFTPVTIRMIRPRMSPTAARAMAPRTTAGPSTRRPLGAMANSPSRRVSTTML